MFRFLSGNKRPVSPARPSFRPQLETLEGRTLPSGFVPVSQDLAPQNLFQSPAHNQVLVQQGPIQIQPISISRDAQTLKTLGFVIPKPDSTSYRISLENGLQISPLGGKAADLTSPEL